MSRLRVTGAEREKLLITNSYLEDATKGLELVSNLIAMPETKNETQTLLNEIDQLIHLDLLDLCDKERTANSTRLFEQIELAFTDLEDLTEFHALANKNIVAVGGGFSAGKSHFLNSMVNDMLLPTETTPTTSIPTYISTGSTETIYALNHFNSKIPLTREALKAISHDFHNKYHVSFSHIIKILTVESPNIAYQNITFLDTPGYSKSDSYIKGSNTDEKIAKAHLSIADELIWLVDAAKGTIPSTDIKFIKDLKIKKPILVILNKADLKPAGELQKIMQETKEQLVKANIPFVNVIAYNSDKGEEMGSANLGDFLGKVNNKLKLSVIKRDFEIVFEAFQKNSYEEIEKEQEQLKLLNTVYLHIDSLKDDDRRSIKGQIDRVKKRIAHLREVNSAFRALGEQVFEKVDRILSEISVKGEKKEELGVVGFLQLKDKKDLMQLNVGDEIEGTIKSTSHFGVFISCPNNNEAFLPIQELTNSLIDPVEKVFKVNARVNLTVIDIEHTNQTATIVTKF